jgi:hypothetical protein
MKTYIHARLTKDERAALEELKKASGQSESELVRRGLKLVARQVKKTRRPLSALDLAGPLVGCVKGGPKDLSTNPEYMDGFGE